jgi:hypothetical protein
MARVVVATKAITEDGNGIQVNFTDGNSVVVFLSDLSEDIRDKLALHGLSQKLGDSYAGEPEVSVAFSCASNVAKRLAEGNWNAVREGGGGGKVSDLALALGAETGKDIAACVEAIDAMDKTQRSGLRKHPRIAARLAQLAADRAAKKAEKAQEGAEEAVDLGALLG